ncbi:glycosyl hydrolase family 65 protein, partial [Acinetobacter baumannii]
GILGIRREGGRLFVDPVLPAAWNGYSATLTLDGRKLSVRVDRGDDGGWQAIVNGTVIKSSNEGYLL